jgi:hypothetical protein
LCAGSQRGDETDLGTEMTRIGGDGAQGRGCNAEQNVVDDEFVLQGDRGDRLGDGEDNMEVRHR